MKNMENSDILKYIDHTLLSSTATYAQIQELCGQAVRYGTASVCIPPAYVKRVHDQYWDSLAVCTVIGFPLGYSTTAGKVAEATAAVSDGARELDMVVNLTDVKNGDFDKVTAEIAAVKKAAGGNILKVIVEACYLNEQEKIAMCKCVTEGGAEYIKTSTGMATSGAILEDILLFKKHIGPHVKIKAAGGIRTREAMVAFIEAGCSRLGTSAAALLFD